MQSFLQLVANDLSNKFDGDFSKTAVVFPNKRASLFFNEYLAKAFNRPVWAPSVFSISELFGQLSTVQTGDTIRLVFDLYNLLETKYNEQDENNKKESLDEFYFWGEILVNDFDDIDKNLVEADKLFANLRDLKEYIDDFEYLNEEQIEAIKLFFKNFSLEHRTEMRKRFFTFWSKLGDIYNDYKSLLKERNYAYEGMVYREAVENFNPDNLRFERYIFIGFNALNSVEEKLFILLKKHSNTNFYWDYDKYYTEQISNHEAGTSIKRNLILFPNELSEDLFDNMNTTKNITYISASTENAQARFIPKWIDSIKGTYEVERDNAVVMCNENILLPVLHSLPDEMKNVNITMGFPLSQTPIYSLINLLINLQTDGYREKEGRFMLRQVSHVLSHNYIEQRSQTSTTAILKELRHKRKLSIPKSELIYDEFLGYIFSTSKTSIDLCRYISDIIKEVSTIYKDDDNDTDGLTQLYKESVFIAYTIINRLHNIIESGSVTISIDTLRKLIDKILKTTKIPFHGEPAVGLQVMGVLETRNLDFKNLLLLSANEGLMPKQGREISFVPYNLRKGFGMTTLENNDAVYSYYFYRLIQRAENITVMYNSSTEGLVKGEESRFMLQLLVESNHNIRKQYLDSHQQPILKEPISVSSSEDIVKGLINKYTTAEGNKYLSPTAINTFVDCSLKFYFRYIASIKTEDEVTEDIDGAIFGLIFHRSAELAYTYLAGENKIIRGEDIDSLLKDKQRINDFVDTAFKEKYFNISVNSKAEYDGIQLINHKVITTYLTNLLKFDRKRTPFVMEGMEKLCIDYFDVETFMGMFEIPVGGIIDRIDSKDGVVRVVDYKTGGKKAELNELEKLFVASKDRKTHILQIFLYASMLSRKEKVITSPALIYLPRVSQEDYQDCVLFMKEPITDFGRQVGDEYRKQLHDVISKIFNHKTTFCQTNVDTICEYCDYKSICGR